MWSGRSPLPDAPSSHWVSQRGSQHRVIDWQATGQDYRLFTRQQLAGNPAWPSTDAWPHVFNVPEAGLTMGQAWNLYGMAERGEALKELEAVALEGPINGLAHGGLDAKLGPPRAIVTSPNLRAAAPVADGVITVDIVLTGDPKAASDVVLASVDGGPQQAVGPRDGGSPDIRSFSTNHTEEG